MISGSIAFETLLGQPYGFAFRNDGTLVVTEAFGAQKARRLLRHI